MPSDSQKIPRGISMESTEILKRFPAWSSSSYHKQEKNSGYCRYPVAGRAWFGEAQ